MATFSFLLIALLEFLISILGAFGNFITCCVIFRNKQLQRSAYFLIVSLAFADLITCAVLVPTRSLQHLGVFIHNKSLTQFGLAFVPAIGRVTLLASFFNLAVLSIDRLIAVSFPFYYRLNLRNSKKGVAIVILCIWMLSISLTSLPELIDKKIGSILFVSCLIATTFVILVSNARVLFIVRRQSRFRRQLMPTTESEKKAKPLHNSYFKPVDEDKRELDNDYQGNEASFFVHNTNLQQDMPENLNKVKYISQQDSCYYPVSTRHYSLNLGRKTTKRQRTQPKSSTIYQASEISSPNSRNRECIEQTGGGSTVNIRRASWPNVFSRNYDHNSDKITYDKEIKILGKDDSNTGLEIHVLTKELPEGRPNTDITSHIKSTFITANIRRPGNSEEKKTAISVATVILVFIILVYPRISLMFYHFFYPETLDTGVVRLWLRVLMYANSAANPVLYAWRMPMFRNAFRKMITCKKY